MFDIFIMGFAELVFGFLGLCIIAAIGIAILSVIVGVLCVVFNLIAAAFFAFFKVP
ncbi:MAG: hypothetical protein LBP54_02795 [Campylobacteraceae bacterium]|jgi:hypothetical protein|nr:hypothetical protein [Campylobacteraceae bacterium]